MSTTDWDTTGWDTNGWDTVPGQAPPVSYPTPPSSAAPAPPPAPPEGPSAGPRGRRWRVPGAIALVVALLLGGFGIGRATQDNTSASRSGVTTPITTSPPATAPGPVTGNADEPVAAAAAALSPAVVQLESATGLGSGVIFDKEGHILTAAHVVGQLKSITVRLADGSTLDGTVVGADPFTDVAVVQVKDDGTLPVATLGTGVVLEVGQLVVAIGSPFGLDQTVTAGYLSAINRAVPTDGGSAVGMLQTDAPINPGNSGGPLSDRQGRVIGINDAIQSDSGGNVGVGFAIPIDTAAEVAKELIGGQPLRTAFLGVTTADRGTGRSGALVVSVSPSSPAASAGLQKGDLITSIDGSPVQSSTDLVARVRADEPGVTVTLTITRSGAEQQVQVTLGQLQR